MKKILFFSLICLMALSVNAQWVDLGLPSGTLWKDKNEKGKSTPSDLVDAWNLGFDLYGVYVGNYRQCYGHSVRLVKNKACARKSASRN